MLHFVSYDTIAAYFGLSRTGVMWHERFHLHRIVTQYQELHDMLSAKNLLKMLS